MPKRPPTAETDGCTTAGGREMSPEEKYTPEPVTVSVSRKVLPGKEEDYERWIGGVTEAAGAFQGHLGVNVLRPGSGGAGRYIIIYRFDTDENAGRWENSAERQKWVSRLEGLVEGEADTKKVSGLEFWFDLPDIPVTAKPSLWRMALLTTVVVYGLVLSLSEILGPLLAGFPFWGKLLVIIPVQVLLMTYVVMPRITRWFKRWIFPGLS